MQCITSGTQFILHYKTLHYVISDVTLHCKICYATLYDDAVKFEDVSGYATL